jgi:DNA polymerase III alpha subunit
MAEIIVGIDIAKKHLDVHLTPAGESFRLANDAPGHRTLVARLQGYQVRQVVLESTGGYEAAVVGELHQAGLPVAVRTTSTQNGQTMMFLTLEDEFGLFEATVFPDLCRRIRPPVRYRPYIITGGVHEQYGAITITAKDVREHQIQQQPAVCE